MTANLLKSSVKSKSDSEITVKKNTAYFPPNDPYVEKRLDELQHHHSDVELPLAIFYDTEIKIGEKILRAHRAHLIQHSSYFEKIFEHNTLPFVTLDVDPAMGISAPMFEMLLQWMYTGNIRLRVTNLDDVLKGAERLEMKGLQVKCNQFLLNVCQSRGPMMVHELAVNSRFEGIKYFSMKYASRNFLQLTSEAKFTQYSSLQLINLLSDDHLAVPSEKLVFDAAVVWLKAKWRTRRACLPQIIECIRFSTMSLEELIECCRPQDGFIVKHPAVIGQFFKAFLYRMAQRKGYENEYQSLGPSSSKCRSFPVTSSEVQHFNSRLLYQSLLEVGGMHHTRKSEAPLRRTKSSIL